MKSVPLKNAVWEMNNGPIPEGHHVKQVNEGTDFRPENLSLAPGEDPHASTPVIELDE